MTPSFVAVIPARFASTRLPGKPLLEIAGRPMIEHVWRSACASSAARVVIATDDRRIAECAEGFGAEVAMTLQTHVNGTSRLAEVAERLQLESDTCVVNVQGDEPLLPSAMIDRVAETLAADAGAAVSTLAEPIDSLDELMRTATVKVVCDNRGRALYFSRAPIPWDRDRLDLDCRQGPLGGGWLRHIGIYAYRASFLRRYCELPIAPLEQCEQLEQLRALYHGFTIAVATAPEHYPAGVDTPEDLARVRALLREKH
ncbi:3-deoxy-manno-octulosonate cytidylyltransferase [Kushneria aurantia]|uniref:3-deoxy-manno-octulosonate cytidylyltransferase n=1 Tax=Kushneria aurantia TaxID=504092 RepID=A0ABV6G6V0_9GAMM|nr:3-deoxy-manno-octulosonate cytidylyltransferase [Kushneria aurantia]